MTTADVTVSPERKGSGLGIAGFATSCSGFVIGLGSMVFMFMLPLATSAVTLGLGYIIALDEPPLNLRTGQYAPARVSYFRVADWMQLARMVAMSSASMPALCPRYAVALGDEVASVSA